jgi:hypothetical protein
MSSSPVVEILSSANTLSLGSVAAAFLVFGKRDSSLGFVEAVQSCDGYHGRGSGFDLDCRSSHLVVHFGQHPRISICEDMQLLGLSSHSAEIMCMFDSCPPESIAAMNIASDRSVTSLPDSVLVKPVLSFSH